MVVVHDLTQYSDTEDEASCNTRRTRCPPVAFPRPPSNEPELRRAVEHLLNAVDTFPAAESAAYERCLQESSNLLQTESNLVAFLRSEDYHIYAAASRLTGYWTLRRELFGDRTYKPMNLSGDGALTHEDIEELRTGFLTLLPDDKEAQLVPDASVTCESEEQEVRRQRCRFYLLTVASHHNERAVSWMGESNAELQALLSVLPFKVMCHANKIGTPMISLPPDLQAQLNQHLAQAGLYVARPTLDASKKADFVQWLEAQVVQDGGRSPGLVAVARAAAPKAVVHHAARRTVKHRLVEPKNERPPAVAPANEESADMKAYLGVLQGVLEQKNRQQQEQQVFTSAQQLASSMLSPLLPSSDVTCLLLRLLEDQRYAAERSPQAMDLDELLRILNSLSSSSSR